MFQFALPHLRKTEGNIINDTSLVAQIGQPGAVTYVATKVNSHVVRLPTCAYGVRDNGSITFFCVSFENISFMPYQDVTIASEGLQKLGLCLTLMRGLWADLTAFEPGGMFIVPHLHDTTRDFGFHGLIRLSRHF